MLVERQALVNVPHVTCDDTFPVLTDGLLVEHSQKLRIFNAV